MKKILYKFMILILIGYHIAASEAAQLDCNLINMKSAVLSLKKRTTRYHIDNASWINNQLKKLKHESDQEKTCQLLSLVRNYIARYEGPRVFNSTLPDPLIRLHSHCSTSKKYLHDYSCRINKTLTEKYRVLYPLARINLNKLYKQAENIQRSHPKVACEIYDEIAEYLQDIFSKNV